MPNSQDGASPSPLMALLRLPTETMVQVIAEALETCAVDNDASGRGPLTRFHARVKPTISLQAYLDRLVTFAPFPADVVVLAVYYIQQIATYSSLAPPTTKQPPAGDFQSMASPGASARSRRPVLNSYTVHRLLAAALVVSAKFLSDSFIPHARACRVAGVGPSELTGLEVEFLVQLKFELLWPVGALDTLAAHILDGTFRPLQLKLELPERPAVAESPTPLSRRLRFREGSDASVSPAVSTPGSEEAPSLASEGNGPATPESSVPSTPPPESASTSVTPKLVDARLAAYVEGTRDRDEAMTS